MSTDAALALHRAVLQALRSDTELTLLLGGPHVHDRPPRRSRPPYVVMGDVETRDWSTFEARGHEHMMTLHVWSEHGGRREAYEIIGRMDAILDGVALDLEGHRLVNLRTVFWTVLRSRDGRLFHGIMRLRATTHPLN